MLGVPFDMVVAGAMLIGMVAEASEVLLRHLQDARAPRRDQFAFRSYNSWMSPEPMIWPAGLALDDHL